MCPRGPPAWGGCQFAGKTRERRKPPSRAEHSTTDLKRCERRCRKMVDWKDLGSESLCPKPALPLMTCGTFSTFQTWRWATQFLCQWRTRWPSFWKCDRSQVSCLSVCNATLLALRLQWLTLKSFFKLSPNITFAFPHA